MTEEHETKQKDYSGLKAFLLILGVISVFGAYTYFFHIRPPAIQKMCKELAIAETREKFKGEKTSKENTDRQNWYAQIKYNSCVANHQI
jgi:hypothetical protein